jgi:hypothetical protein
MEEIAPPDCELCFKINAPSKLYYDSDTICTGIVEGSMTVNARARSYLKGTLCHLSYLAY